MGKWKQSSKLTHVVTSSEASAGLVSKKIYFPGHALKLINLHWFVVVHVEDRWSTHVVSVIGNDDKSIYPDVAGPALPEGDYVFKGPFKAYGIGVGFEVNGVLTAGDKIKYSYAYEEVG